MYEIPIKDGKEFFVVPITWKGEKHRKTDAMYIFITGIIFGIVFPFILATLSSESLSGKEAVFLSSFVFVGGFFWIWAYWTYRQSDVDFITSTFLKKFVKNEGRRFHVQISYWIDREYNDTPYDYLILNIQTPFLTESELRIYMRGDIVLDIMKGLKPPEDWDAIDLDEISKNLNFLTETTTGDRKKALLFTRVLLDHDREAFKEAFIRQPTYSLRYLDEIRAGNLPLKEGMEPE